MATALLRINGRVFHQLGNLSLESLSLATKLLDGVFRVLGLFSVCTYLDILHRGRHYNFLLRYILNIYMHNGLGVIRIVVGIG